MDLHGKTILITGSTDGVGRWVARRLAAGGAHVLLHGRSAERGREVLEAIRAEGGSAELLPADLSSLAEVRRLAEAVLARHDRLDGLINNAGLGTGPNPHRETSADGHELRFAVNYLAGFLLTRLLLPALRRGVPSRIVNVASAGQQEIDFDDVMLTHGYSGIRAYCQSKLAQILFTFDLAEQLRGSGVTATCLHPATYMDTTMVRQSGTRPISTVEEGGEAIMALAVSPKLEGRSGVYFSGRHPSRPLAQAEDPEARQRLRKLSERLTDLEPG